MSTASSLPESYTGELIAHKPCDAGKKTVFLQQYSSTKCLTHTKVILPPHRISLGMHKQSVSLPRQHNGV